MAGDAALRIAGSASDDVAIDRVRATVGLVAGQPVTTVEHVRVSVPATAFDRIIAAAAGRAGLNARGALGAARITVSVSVSLLKVSAIYAGSVDGGRLVMTPQGGLPGWLLGRAAAIINRTAGVSMASDGRVTVDPTPFLPDGVRLDGGFRSIDVSADRIELTLGG